MSKKLRISPISDLLKQSWEEIFTSAVAAGASLRPVRMAELFGSLAHPLRKKIHNMWMGRTKRLLLPDVFKGKRRN